MPYKFVKLFESEKYGQILFMVYEDPDGSGAVEMNFSLGDGHEISWSLTIFESWVAAESAFKQIETPRHAEEKVRLALIEVDVATTEQSTEDDFMGELKLSNESLNDVELDESPAIARVLH